jgi:hypothetical protein
MATTDTYTYTADTGGEKVIIEFNTTKSMYTVNDNNGFIFNIKKDDIEKLSEMVEAGDIEKLFGMITMGNIKTPIVETADQKTAEAITANANIANVVAANSNTADAPMKNIEQSVLSNNANPTNTVEKSVLSNNAKTPNIEIAVDLTTIAELYNKIIIIINGGTGTDKYADNLNKYKATLAKYKQWNDTQGTITSNINDDDVAGLSTDAITATISDAVDKSTSNTNIINYFDITMPTVDKTVVKPTFSPEDKAKFTKSLLEKGENVKFPGNSNITLLHYVAAKNNVPAVDILLNKGAKINLPDADGKTPLHYAILHNGAEMVEHLLKNRNIEINLADKHGHTPLHYAVAKQNANIVEQLIANKANKERVDNKGNRPVYYAANFRNEEIKKLLKADEMEPTNNGAANELLQEMDNREDIDAAASAAAATPSNIVISPNVAADPVVAVGNSFAAAAAASQVPSIAAPDTSADVNPVVAVGDSFAAASAAASQVPSIAAPDTAAANPLPPIVDAAAAASAASTVSTVIGGATVNTPYSNLINAIAKDSTLYTVTDSPSQEGLAITVGGTPYLIKFKDTNTLTPSIKKYYIQLLKKQIFITVKTLLLEMLHTDKKALFDNDICSDTTLVNPTKDTLCNIINPIIQDLLNSNNKLQKAADNETNYALQEQYYNNANRLIQTLRSQRNRLLGNKDANEQIDKLKEQRKTLEPVLYNHYLTLYTELGDLNKTDAIIKNAERLDVSDIDVKALIDSIKTWYNNIKADHIKYRTEFYNKYKQYGSWKQALTPGRFRGGENKTRRAKNDGKKKTRKI